MTSNGTLAVATAAATCIMAAVAVVELVRPRPDTIVQVPDGAIRLEQTAPAQSYQPDTRPQAAADQPKVVAPIAVDGAPGSDDRLALQITATHEPASRPAERVEAAASPATVDAGDRPDAPRPLEFPNVMH